jgi:hypothetical protein
LEGGGVLKRGLVDVALLAAFPDKVSTKLDLMAGDTDDKVAQRRREGSMGKGETVGAPEDVKRSALRCSIVVVFIVYPDRTSEGDGD